MKTLKFIFIFLLLTNFSIAKTSKLAVWGKIVEHESVVDDIKYFVTYTENGKSYAYPLNLGNYKTKDLSSLRNQFVRINGIINSTSIKIEGRIQKTTVVYPTQIDPMKVSDLAIGLYSPSEKDLVKSAESKYDPVRQSGGFELNDKTANTVILSGAALLLASILSK